MFENVAKIDETINKEQYFICFILYFFFLFRTHSCQVNFDRLKDFNQKVLQIKLSNPETARSVLEDSKISNNEIDER